MPIREFTDAGGVRWRVWATTPSRGNVRPQFAAGWLTFECSEERRRLAPIPDEWEEMASDALCDHLTQALTITREVPSALAVIQPRAVEVVLPAEEDAEMETTLARVRDVIRAVEQTLRQTG